MPTPPTRPTNYPLPFAVSGTRNTIAATPTGDNHASFSGGFPPITMQPITSGGVPPSGADFNGLIFDLMTHTVWINAGGQYQFDSTLSTAMGGYPLGMVLQNNAGTASYISLVNNNTTDFNATPSSIGTLWGAYSGAAFSNASTTTTGGTTTLTAIQAIANVITITGALTSNAVVTFPATLGEWEVINSTTGLFTLTCVPAGGAGVTIKQGAADAIYCDATNINYVQASAPTRSAKDASQSIANTLYSDRAASRVGGYSADTGTVDNYVIATVPPTTGTPADGQTVRFRPAHASSGAASTLNAGGGAVTLIKGDSSPPRVNDLTTTAVITATYVAAVSAWVINGLIIPDTTINPISGLFSTQTLSHGEYLVNTSAGAFACNLNATPATYDALKFSDAMGTFATNNFTLLPTGGKSIIDKNGNSQTTLVCNTKGWIFTIWYDGTNWRLI
jgi:hypothetical protein